MIRKRLFMLLLLAGSIPAFAETLQFHPFGTVTIYRRLAHPDRVVLFVSGDGGWNRGVVDMARQISDLDALVVGIDIREYLQRLQKGAHGCLYPASDFEALSQFVQKTLEYPSYRLPLLLGYSSGATLVYASIVQAPPGTFLGAVSLGFCPDLPLSVPMCRGNGLTWISGSEGKESTFLPARNLQAPWVALQGDIDQVCSADAVETFVRQMAVARLVQLPRVGHGFSVPRNWLPQLRAVVTELAPLNSRTAIRPAGPQRPRAPTASLPDVTDLPLVTLPLDRPASHDLAVIYSGDGGWANIDRSLGGYLAARGVPVLGVNSLEYFWKRRTPDGAARDLERILRHFVPLWNRDRIVLIGYSRGADVAPFLVSRLPDDLRNRIRLIALLGPSTSASFEFRVTDWVGGGRGGMRTSPELEKIRSMRIDCFYGREEKDSLCREPEMPGLTRIELQGSHHFGGDYGSIADRILSDLGLAR